MKHLLRSIILITLLFSITAFAQAYHTIYEIQGQGPDSPYDGQVVTTRGIVTGVFAQGFYIEERPGGEWRGIYVYTTSSPTVSREDSVEVTGEIDEYWNLTEFTNDPTVTVLASGVSLPGPTDTTTGELGQEKYEGVYAVIHNLIVTDTSGFGQYDQWYVDDGSGVLMIDYSLMIGVQGSYAYQPIPGDTIAEIRGISNYSFWNYKLVPRRNNDIILTKLWTTIYEIQGQDSLSPLQGDTVTTYGVVSAVRNGEHKGYFLTEHPGGEWRGIFVFTDATPGMTRGDSIKVTGYVREFSPDGIGTRTELVLLSDSLIGSGSLPSPTSTSTNNLSDEKFEGVIVSVSDAQCYSTPDTAGIWEVNDGSGTASVANLLYAYSPTIGHQYDMSGIVDYWRGFVLLPRDASDIIDLSAPITASIYDIQYDRIPGTDSSKYIKYESVITYGIVTGVFSQGFFIEENPGGAWRGIYVYGSNPSVSRGDSVEVRGKIVEYWNTTEFTDNPSVTILSSDRELPEPVDTTTQELGQEKYEGVYCRIKDALVTTIMDYNDEWYLNDGSGELMVDYTMLIEKQGSYYYEPVPGDTIFRMDGILHYSFYHYKLVPREDRDLQLNPVKTDLILCPEKVFRNDSIEIQLFVGFPDSVDEPLKGLKITLNTFFDWDLSSLSLLGSGTEGAVIDVYDNLITIDSISVVDSMIVNFGEQLVPDTTGEFGSKVETSFDGLTFREIKPSPSLKIITPPDSLYPISTIQGTGYESPFNGENVWLQGIITTPNFSEDGYNGYVQDSTGGINIYSSSTLGLQFGYRYLMWGGIEEYNGITEFKPEPDSIILLSKRNNPVIPETLSLSVGLSEQREGKLITITDAIVIEPPTIPSGGGYNCSVRNGQTALNLRISTTTDIVDSLSLDKNTRWDITGVVGQYDPEEPYTSGYQLLPRFISDFVAGEIEGDTTKLALSIEPNPFAPDQGKIARITVSAPANYRINGWLYDVVGREIKQIITNHPGPLTVNWLGKDKQGRRVTIGTYILHIEATSPLGKITSITQPIVVATDLGG